MTSIALEGVSLLHSEVKDKLSPRCKRDGDDTGDDSGDQDGRDVNVDAGGKGDQDAAGAAATDTPNPRKFFFS